MHQVLPPISIVQKILGEQKTDEGASYRLTAHCLRAGRPEGALLYHTLTGELLLLSHEEAALLEKLPGPVSPALEELIPRWFLRPDGADDMALADQVLQIGSRFGKKETALTKYRILTTMDCNARCFYCFETGWEKSSMTEQTARDTAAYIAAHRGGKPVHLEWFGGEPLVNARAIDIITDSLRQQGVPFRSEMTSNAYLFDEALAGRAKDDWALEQVQITLDGTEEVYNQRKAYVHPQGSPFQRVLRNIDLLLDVGIKVKVRLNMDRDNERDLYALVDELAERFGGKPGFSIYATVLFENAGSDPHSYTEGERRAYVQKRMALLAHIQSKGLLERVPLKRRFTINACSADDCKYTTVTPEGRLGRCTSCEDGAIWGSIYTDAADENVLRQWKERCAPWEGCKTCPIYPQCLRLKKCPRDSECCSSIERSIREERLRRAVLGAYEEQKAAGHV